MSSYFDSAIEYNHTHPLEQNKTPTFEKNWEWTYLVRKCRNLELEETFEMYMRRLRVDYLSLFIFIMVLVTTTYALLLLTSANLKYAYIDLIVYIVSGALIWLILYVNFREELITKHGWLAYASTWLAVTVMIFMDIGLSVYHATSNNDILNPIYDAYTLYAIYMFMPIPFVLQPFILGTAVTFCYIINYSFVVSSKEDDQVHSIVNETIYLVCVNCMGIFFRWMRDIALRTTFLDRRQYIEENLLLRYARDQEKSLLLSILPAQIAGRLQEEVRKRIERSKQQQKLQNNERMHTRHSDSTPIVKRWRQPDHEKLFIEKSKDDVTILYADVVNYTYLTTTLDVKTLVEALHDLFVHFDIASEEYNVMRIKFLGDCYYCVAGLDIPNKDHAKCCVDLGLRMIKDIRSVRDRRHLDIDMRIGVHSGYVLSGVIGNAKLQFDIWSKDVDIANRLESTGATGRVHVSDKTLGLLDGEYFFEAGTEKAREDPVLKKHGIRTFLIKKPIVPNDPRRVQRQRQLPAKKLSDPTKSTFMYNMHQYNQVRTQAKLEMCRELDKMPIGRIQLTKVFKRNMPLTQDEMEEEKFRRNISSFCLFFDNRNWEVQYMKEPDVMWKYSMALGWLVYCSLLTIQMLSKENHYLIINCTTLVVLTILLIISWYKKLWIMYVFDSEVSRPRSRISRYLYRMSDAMQRSVAIRIVVYFLFIISYCVVTAMHVIDCRTHGYLQTVNDYEEAVLCFHPWILTNCMTLIIGMTFNFTRIPFIIKGSLSAALTLAYAMLVVFEFHEIIQMSPSTNVYFNAEYSHILFILLTLGIFHLMERQTEFIAKVDYNWKRQLLNKQDDTSITNDTIKHLLINILPAHVANFYLTESKNDLYYEEYDNVAVMFATIKNFDTDKIGLRVLNEIICDFDDVLNNYADKLRVEKIKVANWTYMAACGLDISRSEQVNAPQVQFRNKSLMPNGRRSRYGGPRTTSTSEFEIIPPVSVTRECTDRPQDVADGQYEGNVSCDSSHANSSAAGNRKQDDEVVEVMARFALDLMRTMRRFNAENMQSEYEGSTDYGMLRIGISHGRAMAGVVGISKPLYDIWGNPVNMASRMDSTGIPGQIQVTENTAIILRKCNIKCNYRGMTFVKGRGNIPTYILGTDSEFKNFLPHHPEATTTSSSSSSSDSDIDMGS